MKQRMLFMLAITGAAGAQTQLSPIAAYEQATRPIEVVHRSVANWSDSELASLGVAIKNGAEACSTRKPEDFAGDQLIAYARLCSLGINWPAVGVATSRYIESKDEAKPQLALAYGMKLESVLQGHSVPDILATSKAMLAAVPYDATVDTASNEALEYLQLAYTHDALELHTVRLPILLAAMAAEKPVMPLHLLYADGLAKAALEQYARKPEAAEATRTQLQDSVAQATTAGRVGQDETVLMRGLDAQYAMLGKPLPALTLGLSLADMKTKPMIDPGAGAATALLLFPAWCAQCVRMSAEDLNGAVAVLGRGAVKLYALLAEPPLKPGELAELKADPKAELKADPKAELKTDPRAVPAPAKRLLHTQTILVPLETVDLLHASDFPWLVVLDNAGRVRFQGVAPEKALKQGDFIDRATDHVAEQWPSKFVPSLPARDSITK